MPPKRFPKREPSSGKQPPIARPRPQVANQSTSDGNAGPSSGASADDVQQRYEEELAWCIHRLKLSLSAKNVTPKQAEDIRKSVLILENPHENVVKKRCVMQTSLGNYRQQMEQEKSKLSLELRNARIANASSASSGQFMRKSQSATTEVKTHEGKFTFQPSENSFRFNFGGVDNNDECK